MVKENNQLIYQLKMNLITIHVEGEENIVKKLPEVDSSEELCVEDCGGGESDEDVGHMVEHVDDHGQHEDGRRLIQPDETLLFLRATATHNQVTDTTYTSVVFSESFTYTVMPREMYRLSTLFYR